MSKLSFTPKNIKQLSKFKKQNKKAKNRLDPLLILEEQCFDQEIKNKSKEK